MSQPLSSSPDDAPEAGPASTWKARHALLRRLADLVSLPTSRINAFERSVVGDLLVEMARLATPEDRLKMAHRLAPLAELPNGLMRLMLRDEPAIAGVLIEGCAGLTDADLLSCVRDTGHDHRRCIAARRGVSEVVSEALIEAGHGDVVETLLRNTTARLSQTGIETAVALSRAQPRLCEHLLRRPELRPSGAYVMFWWSNEQDRRTILQRFAVSREVMQEVSEDIFAMAADEGWQDPVSRKALQFIERRQRNRGAIDKSPYDSLEHAITEIERQGMGRDSVAEIAYLSGIKPLTGAKILGDPGGEPVAILCKATGLDREYLTALWRSMKRPETLPDGSVHPTWERVQVTFEMLAVDRAQTVLRYWNWSLTSAMTPALLKAIREGDTDELDEYSIPERAAMMALAQDFGR
jgi:uncharacterized protein (DUF2336 family)